MKITTATLVVSAFLFNTTALLACPQCRPQVKAEVYNQDFAANLFLLLLPLAILLALGIGLNYSDTLLTKWQQRTKPKTEAKWRTT